MRSLWNDIRLGTIGPYTPYDRLENLTRLMGPSDNRIDFTLWCNLPSKSIDVAKSHLVLSTHLTTVPSLFAFLLLHQLLVSFLHLEVR